MRDGPYIVDLPLLPRSFQMLAEQIERFHEDRAIKITRHPVRIDDGKFFVRFCFVSRTDARAFQSLFGERALTDESHSAGDLPSFRGERASNPFDVHSAVPSP
jgi:hypothetical protein